MDAHVFMSSFHERKPIVKEDLKRILNIHNQNTLNQTISYLVSFGVLKRFENGIYYVPSSNEKFSHLKPSLNDVIKKKYLDDYHGIRTGAYLLYKYKLTSQVSTYYEILSHKVSPLTRSKHLYNGKVIVSYPPFKVNKHNIHYLEFLEVIKYIHFSDDSIEKSQIKLINIKKQLHLSKEEIIAYSKYYNGKRYAGFREVVKEIAKDEIASK